MSRTSPISQAKGAGSPALELRLFRPGDRVCVAVSGGADSVAMLLLLLEANGLPRGALGLGLSAVHIHHGIRGTAADQDSEFVRDLCDRLGVPLRVVAADVPARRAAARFEGESETLEEAARNIRMESFRGMILSGEVNVVATAHTLDDQAETVLMKLLRGAWTEGLAGIFPAVEVAPANASQPRSSVGRIVRPLLATRRADLRSWLESRDQSWREDRSNADTVHTRNRLRHTLLPLLRKENPSIDVILGRLATLAREDEARWSADVNRLLPQLLLPGKPVRGGGRAVGTETGEGALVAIELERLRALDAALRRRVLRAAARRLGCRLGFEDTERLLELVGLSGNVQAAAGSPRPKGRLILHDGLVADCSPRELRLQQSRDAQSSDPLVLR